MATSQSNRRAASRASGLAACPQCAHDAIFVDYCFAVEFDGGRQVFGGKRVPAYCNNPSCDQRFWYYPDGGRITRRNTGPFSRYYRPPVTAEVGEKGPEIIQQARAAFPEAFEKKRPRRKLSFRIRRCIHRLARLISIAGYRAQGAKV